MESTFFLNGSGMPLGRIQNSTGSMLRIIGTACGIPDLNPTMLRQATEAVIQRNPKMKNKADVLNCHSKEVGQKVYDQSNTRTKSEFTNFMNKKENPSENEILSNIDSDKKSKMKALAKADNEARLKNAQEYLDSLKAKTYENTKLGKRVKVNQLDRILLQQLIFQDLFGSIKQDFPKGIYLHLSLYLIFLYMLS